MNKPSALVDTRVIYCGDNLKLPAQRVDLVYINASGNHCRATAPVAVAGGAPALQTTP